MIYRQCSECLGCFLALLLFLQYQKILHNIYKENLEKQEAKIVLEQHTSGLPSVKKRHIEKVFAGKSAEFIKENYQFTLEMFEKSETEKLQTLKEEATAEKQVAERPVGEKQEVVEESVEQKIAQSDPKNMQDSNLFTNYMEELNRT